MREPIVSVPSFDGPLSFNGLNILVNSTTEGEQSVPFVAALADGGFVVAWQDRLFTSVEPTSSILNVRAQIFAPDGAKRGEEILVSTIAESGYSLTGLFVTSQPNLLADRRGFLIAWDVVDEDTGQIGQRAQNFTSSGARLGEEFPMPFADPLAGLRQVAQTLTDGRTITVQPQTFEDYFEIVAQIRDRDGALIGNDFVVDSASDGMQDFPAITRLADERVLVAWTDYSEHTSAPNIRAQILDPIIRGTSDDDLLIGTPFDDVLMGLDGNDTLIGGGGRDFLFGGAGRNVLYGDSPNAATLQSTAPELSAPLTIYRLYQAVLDREPDVGGHLHWTQMLASAESIQERAALSQQIAQAFVDSREFQSVYGALGDTDFVEQLYQNILARASDATGLSYWVDQLADGATRGEIVRGFSNSLEFRNATDEAAIRFTLATEPANWSETLFKLYQATLDRTPDLDGFMAWSAALSTGTDVLPVINGFIVSREFQNKNSALEDDDFIAVIYQNVMGASDNGDGLADWTAQFNTMSARAEFVRDVLTEAAFVTATDTDLKSWMRAQGVDDVLSGGSGSSSMWGGIMADVFRFERADAGSHFVRDLEPWDFLEFRGFGYSAMSDATEQMTQSGADTIFRDQGTSIAFSNTALSSLTEDMFLFI